MTPSALVGPYAARVEAPFEVELVELPVGHFPMYEDPAAFAHVLAARFAEEPAIGER